MCWLHGVPFAVSRAEQQQKQLSCKLDLEFLHQLTFLSTAHPSHKSHLS